MAYAPAPLPLSPNEALSGIFGSISLAAWIFVLIPQLYENFKHSDASGISIAFLTVWLIGDITNLIGAAWASLVPTVVALAVYFCFADAILILQVLYYNYWYRRRVVSTASQDAAAEADEEAPLLSRRESGASSIGLPGSHKRRRRRSSVLSDAPAVNGAPAPGSSSGRRASSLAKIDEDEGFEGDVSSKTAWIQNTAGILFICIIGSLGWLICYKTGLWTPAPAPGSENGDSRDSPAKHSPAGAQILGYVSAIAYLGARIPQIVKNWRDKSCEGLSLLFFLLSLVGNLTYGAGVSFPYSCDLFLTSNGIVSRFCFTLLRKTTLSKICHGSLARWALLSKMLQFSSNSSSIAVREARGTRPLNRECNLGATTPRLQRGYGLPANLVSREKKTFDVQYYKMSAAFLWHLVDGLGLV